MVESFNLEQSGSRLKRQFSPTSLTNDIDYEKLESIKKEPKLPNLTIYDLVKEGFKEIPQSEPPFRTPLLKFDVYARCKYDRIEVFLGAYFGRVCVTEVFLWRITAACV